MHKTTFNNMLSYISLICLVCAVTSAGALCATVWYTNTSNKWNGFLSAVIVVSTMIINYLSNKHIEHALQIICKVNAEIHTEYTENNH